MISDVMFEMSSLLRFSSRQLDNRNLELREKLQLGIYTFGNLQHTGSI